MTITVSYGGKELGTTTLVLKKEFKGATATATTVEVTGKIGESLDTNQKITVTLAKPANADASAEDPKFKAVTAEEAKKWITGLPEGITATATAIQENANSVEFTLSGTPTSKTGAVAIAIPAKYIVGQEDTSSETITAITTNVTFNIADGDIAATEITSLPAAVDMVAGTSFTTLEGKIIAKTGDDVHYTKGNIKWFSKDTNGSGNYTEATGKTALEGGKSYQVEITLNADTDWAFTDAAKTAITLPNSKTATDSALDNKKALTFKVELGAVEAGNTGENDTVTGTVTGEVAGTAKVDQTAGTLTDGKKTITVTLDEAYKFVAFDTNNQNALSWFTTPSLTDSGLSVTAAKGTTDNIAILTVGGEATKAVISETVALAIPKELIQKVDGTAITVTGNTVALASTGTAAKFAITSTGGSGNEDANKVSAVVITEPATDKTVNLNDTTTDANKITFKANLQNSASTPTDITEANKTIKWSVTKADGDDGDIKTTAFENVETSTDSNGIATATLTIDADTTAKALVVTAAYDDTDAAENGATSATKNITIVTKATQPELTTIAGLLTDLSIIDVDSNATDIKIEIANKAKEAIGSKIAENTALKDIWTVKSVEVTTSGDITLEQNKETSVNIKVVFSKGNVDISTTDTNSESREIKVTPKTTTSGNEPDTPDETI